MSAGQDTSFKIGHGRAGFLLLHGLAGTPVEMRAYGETLARAGYTVSCPQLAGHCGTFDDLKRSTWQDWAASASAALTDLRKSCDFVVVGGLSTGGVLSLWLAAERPKEVDGVVLLAPTLWINGWVIPWYARFFDLVLQKWFANLIDFPDVPPHGIKNPEIRERVHNAMNSGDSTLAGLPVTPGGAILEHRWLVKATCRRLGEVHQPVLVIHSREDDLADLDNVTYLMRRLSGIVDTVVLNDCYHIITSDQQRHIVSERSIEFVNRIRREALAPRGLQEADVASAQVTPLKPASDMTAA